MHKKLNLLVSLLCGIIITGVFLPAPVSAQTCTPGLAPRLVIGNQARVTPGDPNSIRSQPTTQSDRLGYIPGGAVFTVLDGPVCGNGYTFWRVEYSGIVGWTAEGTTGTYWLEPIAPAPVDPPTAVPPPPTPVPQQAPPPAATPVPAAPDYSNAINNYINGLSYDSGSLLAIDRDQTRIIEETRTDEGRSIVICEPRNNGVAPGELTEYLILQPQNDAIYPGALTAANDSLVRGQPTPINRSRNPMRFEITGLSGSWIDGNSFTVQDLQEESVDGAIQDKLEDWFNSPNRGTNAAAADIRLTTQSRSEAIALELGVDARYPGWSGSVDTAVKRATQQRSAYALYRQVFYTVQVAGIESLNPASIFGPTVSDETISRLFSNQAPPVYVAQVSYGRLLLVTMSTSATATDVEVTGTLDTILKGGRVGVETNAKYTEIVQNSTFNAFALGGDPDIASDVLGGATGGFGALDRIAGYIDAGDTVSRDNPGAPIGYTIRFLKDNELARVGYTMQWTDEVCTRYNDIEVTVEHDAAYWARVSMEWTEPGFLPSVEMKRDLSDDDEATWFLPADATNVRIRAEAEVFINTWEDIFQPPWLTYQTVAGSRDLENGRICIRIYGTTFNLQYDRRGGCNGR